MFPHGTVLLNLQSTYQVKLQDVMIALSETGMIINLLEVWSGSGEVRGLGIIFKGMPEVNKPYSSHDPQGDTEDEEVSMMAWVGTVTAKRPVSGTVTFSALPKIDHPDGEVVTILFDFKTSDGKIIKGSATGKARSLQ